jgi:hypothetical protein
VPQLATSAAIVVALVVLAFLLPRRTAGSVAASAPGAWWVFAGALLLSSAFVGLSVVPSWGAEVAIAVVLLAAAAMAVAVWSRRSGWGRSQRLGLAAGALITYAWHAFTTTTVGGGVSAQNLLVSHAVFAVLALLILGYAARRISRPEIATLPAATTV